MHTETVQYEHKVAATFSVEEAKRFIQAVEDDRLGALFIIALTLGLRKGEVSGLKAEDNDLENRVLHVRRSLQWIKLPDDKEGHWIEKPPKTPKSRRDLPITDTIYRAVIRHMARRQHEADTTKHWHDSGYLFTSVTGAPLHERNLTEAFHQACDRAKVPRIRFHDTRHSCGTMLHAEGASPFIIQAMLGHTQLSTTKRYTAIPLSVAKTALDRVDAVYSAKPKAGEQKETKPAAVTAERVQ